MVGIPSFLLANFLATLHFVIYLEGGVRPLYRYGTKYNVARKLANRNGAIIYAKAGTFGLGYLGSRVPVGQSRMACSSQAVSSPSLLHSYRWNVFPLMVPRLGLRDWG